MNTVVNAQNPVKTGQIAIKGYIGSLVDYMTEEQYLDASLWKLLANQFRIHSDTDGDWRGEFWGKMMRGACLSYSVKPSAKLYLVLRDTVLDLLSCQDKDGRLSAYPREDEFRGWDMWGRKYAMLGLLSFAEISKSESIRKRAIKAASRSADYIMKHVGSRKGKKGIFETSHLYGTMNSASILKVFTSLYNNTGKQKYLDFAKYLVSTGMCKDFDLIGAAYEGKLAPFEYKERKAYEEISCIEGVLEYYRITGEEKYLIAAKNFTNKVLATDFTIIGCSGCDSEFFDNSSKTQVAPKNRIMQETCVTVTLMGLLSNLFELTGDSTYMDAFERSVYNALAGSVNNRHQTMASAFGNVWAKDECIHAPHGPYPFDSYSPLVHAKRAIQVGGFKLLQDGETYGCCACNGGRGIGLLGLYSITTNEKGFFINSYYEEKANLTYKGSPIRFFVRGNLYASNKVGIRVLADNVKTTIALRIPSWSKKTSIYLNGELIEKNAPHGYYEINSVFNKDVIDIKFKMDVVENVIENKVALSKGPIVLALDHRISEDAPIALTKHIKATKVANTSFESNVCYEINDGTKTFLVVDYAEAGKDSDNDNSWISVWQPKA